MKNLKVSRSLWLFAGSCFFISFIMSIYSNASAVLPVLNGVTCILMFINAYIVHKKITKDSNG